MARITVPQTDSGRGQFVAFVVAVVALIVFADKVITIADIVRSTPSAKWTALAFMGAGNTLVGSLLVTAALLIFWYTDRAQNAVKTAATLIRTFGLFLIAATIYFFANTNVNLIRLYEQKVGYGLVYTADPLIGAVLGFGAFWVLRGTRQTEPKPEFGQADI